MAYLGEWQGLVRGERREPFTVGSAVGQRQTVEHLLWSRAQARRAFSGKVVAGFERGWARRRIFPLQWGQFGADVPPCAPRPVATEKSGRFGFFCDNCCGAGHEEMSGHLIVRD
ncbi:hypothetical protein [Niveibacterium sp. SC-1]|uniref:hypothetical protein n=1 Tax=Niveibacterium sp. SC-1 TaxID=3135646 RepID=UPI00311D4D8D